MSDHDAILRAVQSFAAAYNSGDLTAVLSYYDEDLVKIRQGARAESKAETARRVQEVFARFDTKVDVENLEIEVSGDMAFTRGTMDNVLGESDERR